MRISATNTFSDELVFLLCSVTIKLEVVATRKFIKMDIGINTMTLTITRCKKAFVYHVLHCLLPFFFFIICLFKLFEQNRLLLCSSSDKELTYYAHCSFVQTCTYKDDVGDHRERTNGTDTELARASLY